MKFPQRSHVRLLASLAVLFGISAGQRSDLRAVEIGFEAPNYSPTGGDPTQGFFGAFGTIARQGNSPPPHDDDNPCERVIYGDAEDEVGCWGNSFIADGFIVTEGVGVDGSQGITKSSTDGFYRYNYSTDDEMLGFAEGETFDNASSILEYSFDFKLENTASDSVVGDAFNFGVTGTAPAGLANEDFPVMTIKVSDNNRVGIVHADNSNPAGTFTNSFNQAPGDPMLAPGEWQNISGQIDYGSQTFTVEINGIPWTFESSDGLGNYSFISTNAFNIDGANLLLVEAGFPNQPGDTQADYVIDNISLNVASEASGDFDGDGDIDGADFLTWQRGVSGTFDANDLADWQATYGGAGLAGVATAVPEPATLTLLSFTALAICLRRQRVC